jgi:hypothetical protein
MTFGHRPIRGRRKRARSGTRDEGQLPVCSRSSQSLAAALSEAHRAVIEPGHSERHSPSPTPGQVGEYPMAWFGAPPLASQAPFVTVVARQHQGQHDGATHEPLRWGPRGQSGRAEEGQGGPPATAWSSGMAATATANPVPLTSGAICCAWPTSPSPAATSTQCCPPASAPDSGWVPVGAEGRSDGTVMARPTDPDARCRKRPSSWPSTDRDPRPPGHGSDRPQAAQASPESPRIWATDARGTGRISAKGRIFAELLLHSSASSATLPGIVPG